jgi:hypothetical protein
MQVPRLNKVAEKVIILQTDPSGGITPQTVYQKKSGKKKTSRGLKGPQTVLQRFADAAKAFAETVADRSQSSSRKKRDGLLRDLGSNVYRATEKARKKLRLSRVPSMFD